MEAAAGDSDGKIADSESGKLLIEVVHLSVKRVKKLCPWTIISDYTTKLFTSGRNGETIFSRRGVQEPLDRLTRFSAVGENVTHG
jgi:hypothetical protein